MLLTVLVLIQAIKNCGSVELGKMQLKGKVLALHALGSILSATKNKIVEAHL
jgi:hypothetical protein